MDFSLEAILLKHLYDPWNEITLLFKVTEEEGGDYDNTYSEEGL